MSGVFGATLAGHDVGYVVVAGLICAAAGSANYWLRGQHLDVDGPMGWAWVGFRALAAGSGVWAANVLALLGFRDFPLELRPWAVGVALLVAVAAAAPARAA